MTTETDFLTSQNGEKLFYRHWIPTNAKQILCIIHGHGEHSGRYDHLARFLCDQDIAVLAMDLRGHGLSSGKRGHSPSYELLLSGIDELMKTARAIYNDLPLFIMGHSMGGNLVANWIIENISKEVSGYILSSPWFQLAFEPNPIKVKLGKLMNGIWPSYSEKNDLNIGKLSRDPTFLVDHDSDKLVHTQISARLFHIINLAADRALRDAAKINIPGLVYQGDADAVIDHHATAAFASKNSMIEWHLLEGVFHEPHNDLGKEKIYSLIYDWIKAQAIEK